MKKVVYTLSLTISSGVLCISDQIHIKHAPCHSLNQCGSCARLSLFHVFRYFYRLHEKQVKREKPNEVDVGQAFEALSIRGMGDVPGRYARMRSIRYGGYSCGNQTYLKQKAPAWWLGLLMMNSSE